MTSRPRPVTRRRRFSLGDEDRREFLVNAAFVGVIVAVLAILGIAVAVSYWQTNLQPVANVGGVEIRPDMTRARATLLHLRLDREERRDLDARSAGEIDSATLQARQSEIGTDRQQVGFGATEGLIDLIYQSQLASQMGITVTPEDIDQRVQVDLAGFEHRHVQVITIEPETSEGAVRPTISQQRAARERALEAHAQLEAGRSWEDVAAEYSTDDRAATAGDLGFITAANPIDGQLLSVLFDIPAGERTDVIRAADGPYLIGRVVEIRPAGEDFIYADAVRSRIAMDRYREFLGWEVASERLQQRIVDEQLAATPEQLQLAHLRIENVEPGDELADDEEDEIHYSEIVFAPNDDMFEAPDLDENDPAWDEARQEAEAVVAELNAIEDETERLERFRTIAREQSDNESTSVEGGDAGSVTVEDPPSAVADLLFDQQHEPETLLGPVRDLPGYYVLWFHERRDPPSQRLEQLRAALAEPNVDFAALVERFSDDEQSREQQGDLGWWTQDMLNEVDAELGDTLYELSTGETSEPLGIQGSTHVFHISERRAREIDPDQARAIRQSGFARWYDERKQEAVDQGIITRAAPEPTDLEPGVDFGDDVEDGLDEAP